MQKKYKALLALCISIAGFILTYSWANTGFWGGLVNGGFLAAMIGGLADWFAVTALFRKPLGISYRTDILRRNRQRLMQALVDFASKDLLSVENIMEVVGKQDMAKMLVDYLSIRGGRERVRQVLQDVLLEVVKDADIKAAAEELAPAIRQSLKGFPMEKLVQQFVSLLTEERYSERLLLVLVRISGQLLQAPAMQQLLLANIAVLREQYEALSAGRAFVLQAMDLSDEKILAIINTKLRTYLERAEQKDTDAYRALQAQLVRFLQQTAQNEDLARTLASWKERFVDHMELVEPVAAFLEKTLQGGDGMPWLAEINRLADEKMQEFAARESMQRRYDTLVKQFMEKELRAHHDMITRMIRERLDEFSDDQLVEFVESRIEDEVQMIRINGSIVGSLVGMLLYMVVFFMERVYG